ncbi:MAG: hypothetical protein KF887_13155 [Paracoccaceae bacterium]|nr:MAG: hypothetical protein KF887_13155 [Paracoccaceae bacterium]
MSRVKAINWHGDGWLEIEGALAIEGRGDVQVSFFLPHDARQQSSKVVAVWDGQTCHRVEVTRGKLTRLPVFTLPEDAEELRLHIFCAHREAGGNDMRRLGVIMRLQAAADAVIERRLDIAAPGRGFAAHPDRALVAEFMNVPAYCRGFAPREVPSDPVLHYLILGGVTGRDPAPGFSSEAYLRETPAVAESGANPFVHYLREALGEAALADSAERQPQVVRALRARLSGVSEPVADPQPAAARPATTAAAPPLPRNLQEANAHLAAGNRAEAFSLALSALMSGDRAPAAATMLTHIIGTRDSWDRVEASMTDLFDADFYVAQNPGLPHDGADPEVHYLLHGWKEGRLPSPLFDPRHYAAQLPVGLPEGVFPLAHFQHVGRPAGIRGVPDGTTLWPAPPLPEAADRLRIPRLLTDDIVATVHVLIEPEGGDPRPTIMSLLRNRGDAAYDVSVVEVGDRADWTADLAALDEEGHVFWRTAPPGTPRNALLRDVLSGQDLGRAAVVVAQDAQVFSGWFGRLMAHAADPVATVTALSTHAAFAAYPRAAAANLVACEPSAAAIDRLAGTVNAGRAVEVPGADGACVLVTTQALALLAHGGGDTDPVEQIGRRARRAGLRNLVACDLFVPRAGAGVPRSAPAPIVAADSLHNAAVRTHLRADPLRSARRALDLARLAAQGQVTALHISHGMGGGVETYLGQAIRQVPGAAILRLHDGCRMTVETDARSGMFVPNLSAVDLRGDRGLLARCIAAMSPGQIVVHSLSGLSWPMQAQVIEDLAALRGEIVFIGHDYAAISAQYCLLPPDGSPWRGPPDTDTLQAWAAMTDPLAEAGQGDPLQRQAAYAALFDRADRRILPSEAAAAIFRRYFPRHRFEVVAHPPHLAAAALPPRKPDGRLRMVVPGKVWPHKGSRVIEALAETVRRRALPVDLSVVGHSDIDDRLRQLGVRVTGPYRRETEALEHLTHLHPDLLFVPSLWPETHCYTLSFAEALGLRAAVFDLGAQAERARAMPDAVILPLHLCDDADALADALLPLMPSVPEPPAV